MYDIAISFAGEDRDWARALAEEARTAGLDVFYDEFEQANLWGKDLAAHLDTIYRKNALYCVVLISAAYAKKIWPRHEIRSAIARAMESPKEYLLPVRLDDTEIPGLTPTIGYLDGRTLTPFEIVRLLAQKLGVAPDLTLRHTENLLRLAEIGIPCTIFIVDRRFLLSSFEADKGTEFRVAASFGRNITGPEHLGPAQVPPVIEGPYVLALHRVATHGRYLGVWDMWINSRRYESDQSQAAATAAASSWLAELDDDSYANLAAYEEYEPQPIHRSASISLDDYVLDTT
jgi:hypothetical protein